MTAVRPDRKKAPMAACELALIQAMPAARAARDVTQEWLSESLRANGLAFHPPTVYKIEQGMRQVRMHEGYVIAKVLGIDLAPIVDGCNHDREVCRTCVDKPPAGFTCNACGKAGAR